MNMPAIHSIGRSVTRVVALGAAAYAVRAGTTFFRYGHVAPRESNEEDGGLLDHFMPEYEVVERHHIQVAAPPELTFAAACEQELEKSPIVRAIFRTRQLVLGGTLEDSPGPRSLKAQVLSLGWGVLADVPGREIVFGAVTQPWKANVVFTPLRPADFAAFHAPGYVKIVWNLRAEPIGRESRFSTETRAIATDPDSRAKFRCYWSLVSPGVALIRYLSLAPLKHEAERRAHEWCCGETFA